jgi:NADPH-dependent 2,4-dienoyl-CoA reductase/sulfur reductase-like enzyme
MKLLIVGAGAGGCTAAQFARKADRTAEITVLTDESYGEYSKCGLPHAIAGVIPSFDDLIEYSPSWFQRFNIGLQLRTRAVDIDVARKRVRTRSAPSGEEADYEYDALIIATGASPWLPDTKGLFTNAGEVRDGVHVLRTMDQAKAISARMRQGERAMVVGSGSIGMEMAEAASLRGMETSVRLRTHVLTGMLDPDMANMVQERAEAHGIRFIPRSTLVEVGGRDRLEHVVLENLDTGEKTTYPVDLLLVSAGIMAEVALAQKAGCAIGSTGGITIDAGCRTSLPDIYAVGDCTEYPDFVTGEPTLVGLGSIVVKQGRVAGVNAAGGQDEMARGLLNNRTTMLFGLQVTAVGPTLKDLSRAGIDAIIGKSTGWTVPDYYPGKKSLVVKVMAEPREGRIVAAQVVGEQDAAQRANVFAAAIYQEMTLREFMRLETCYAPAIAPTIDTMTSAVDAALIKWQRKGKPR